MRPPRSTALGPREAGPPLPTSGHPSGGEGGLRTQPASTQPLPGEAGGPGRTLPPQPHTWDVERPGDGPLGHLLPRPHVDEPRPAGGQERAEFRKRHGGRCGGARVPGGAGPPQRAPGQRVHCSRAPSPLLPGPQVGRAHPSAPGPAGTCSHGARCDHQPQECSPARPSPPRPHLRRPPGKGAGTGREAPPPAAPVHRAADSRPPRRPKKSLFAGRRCSARVAAAPSAPARLSPLSTLRPSVLP